MAHEQSDPYFVVGGTLTRHAASYVERRADTELLAALMADEYCYVLDTRQVGKSSLIVRAAQRLNEAGRLTAFLDLSTFGDAPTEEQWYGKLLADLVRATGMEDEADAFWEANTQYSGAQRWYLAVRDLVLPHLSAPIVVFVDEIEAVRKLPFSFDSFFALIRAFHNLRSTEPTAGRLTFCLAGVATPADLIRDPRTTPFNIGRRITLRDFTLAEMQPLARGLNGTPIQQETQLRRIGEWTAGHPYLTQRFCHAAFAVGKALEVREIDGLCREVFLRRQAQSEEANLHFVRRQILDDATPDDLLLLYSRVRTGRQVEAGSADALIDRLLLSGLVCVASHREPPRLTVRNPIYARVFDRGWIRSNLSGAEARRQRQALRRGFLRASIVWCVLGASLLFALGRQRQLNWQQGELTKTIHSLHQVSKDLDHKKHEISQAKKERDGLNQTLLNQQTNMKRLDNSARQLVSANRTQRQALIETQRAQLMANAALRRSQQEREAIESNRQAALALRGMATPGQEFEALEHGLDAVRPALLQHHPPTLESVQALAQAVTVGAYRLFSLPHGYRLHTASFSPDSHWIVTAGRSRDIAVWDASTGKLKCKISVMPTSVPEPQVFTAEFSQDGRYLVTAGSDQNACIWDAGTLQDRKPLCVRTISCGDPSIKPALARFSPSGRYLAISGVSHGSPYVSVYNFVTGKQISTLHHEWEINSLDFNNKMRMPGYEERYLALAGGKSPTVRIFDFLSGLESKEVYTYQQKDDGAIQHAVFAYWNDSVYSAGESGKITSWNWQKTLGDKPTSTGDYRKYSGHVKGVSSLAVSPDGHLVASAGANDHLVHIWHREFDGHPLYTLSAHTANVTSVQFSSDSRHLVTASYDGTAEVWLLAAPLYCGSGNKLNYLALSPDGSTMVATTGTNNSGRVLIWNTEANRDPLHILGQSAKESFPGSVRDAEYSPDGKMLATGGEYGNVQVWTLQGSDRSIGPHIKISNSTNATVNGVAFSPDGRRLISASDDHTVQFWDTHSGLSAGVPLLHPDKVYACAFSPDGMQVMTGCTDGNTRLYDSAGHLLQTLQPRGERGWGPQAYPWSVAFSPDGQTLLTGDADGNAYLWNKESGKRIGTLPFRHGQVFSAQFSKDGKRVLAVGDGGYASVWNIEEALAAERKGQQVLPWLDVRSSTFALFGGQFSLDGQYIFVAGTDCLVHRYPATPEALVQEGLRIRDIGGSGVFRVRQHRSP